MGNISFQEAKSFLVYREPESRDKLVSIEKFFKERMSEWDPDEEKHLENTFYLILVKLREYSLEIPEIKNLFDEFSKSIYKIINRWFKGDEQMKISSNGWFCDKFNYRFSLFWNNIHSNQLRAFLNLCDYYLKTLEQAYRSVWMSERVVAIYVMRMDIKKYSKYLKKDFFFFVWLYTFKLISVYWTSLTRLALTCTLSISIFAWIYWLADFFSPVQLRMIKDLGDISSYIFNSLVTITWLWIDARPITTLQRVAMWINTLYWMVVFGLLFNVITTKLSMND